MILREESGTGPPGWDPTSRRSSSTGSEGGPEGLAGLLVAVRSGSEAEAEAALQRLRHAADTSPSGTWTALVAAGGFSPLVAAARRGGQFARLRPAQLEALRLLTALARAHEARRELRRGPLLDTLLDLLDLPVAAGGALAETDVADLALLLRQLLRSPAARERFRAHSAAAPALSRLLLAADRGLRLHALALIADFADEHRANRLALYRAEVLPRVADQLLPPTPDPQQQTEAARALAALLAPDVPALQAAAAAALAPLSELYSGTRGSTVLRAAVAQALAALVDDAPANKTALLRQAGLLERALADLRRHDRPALQAAALGLLRCLARFRDEGTARAAAQVRSLLQRRRALLPAASLLVASPHTRVRAEAAGLLAEATRDHSANRSEIVAVLRDDAACVAALLDAPDAASADRSRALECLLVLAAHDDFARALRQPHLPLRAQLLALAGAQHVPPRLQDLAQLLLARLR